MSTPPDLLEDERYERIVAELRASRPSASPGLRARVESIPTREEARSGRRFTISARRAGLVLAPACVLAAVGVAVVSGLSDGTGQDRNASPRAITTVAASERAGTPASGAEASPLQGPASAYQNSRAPVTRDRSLGAAALPPNSARLQRYVVRIRIRVGSERGLSNAAQRALAITRALGGYVVSVDYGAAARRRGEASVRVRVPRSRVQTAIVRFSRLGTIVEQQIAISDLQGRVDRNEREIENVRQYVRLLEKALGKPDLREDERVELQAKLFRARRELTGRLTGNTRLLREGRLATVSLALTTKKAAAAPKKPDESGRIEGVLRGAWSVLALELAYALYVLIIAAPVLVLAAVAYLLARSVRRRDVERLLERA